MQKFGYLKKYGFNINASSSPMISESSIKMGILSLQEFAGLPVTGDLDSATKKVINLGFILNISIPLFILLVKQRFYIFYLILLSY